MALIRSITRAPKEFIKKPLNVFKDLLGTIKSSQNVHGNRLQHMFDQDQPTTHREKITLLPKDTRDNLLIEVLKIRDLLPTMIYRTTEVDEREILLTEADKSMNNVGPS